MKQSSIIILITVLMCMTSTKAFAYDFKAKNSDGIEIFYKFDSNKNLEVDGFSKNSQFSGKLVIPESVEYKGNTYSVVSIGSKAFFKDNDLKSVSIPKSVTIINQSAFYQCSGLTSIHISDLVAWCNTSFIHDLNDIHTILDYNINPLCYAHHLYLNGKELNDLTIPDGITTIKANAFQGASSLTSVTIPSSVTVIGYRAFYGCSNLTSVIIPNSVTTIYGGAFSDCSSLESLTIPQSVTNIASSAFNCKNLKSIISEIKQPFKIETDVFGYKPNAYLIVPKGTKSSYQTTSGWNKMKYIIEAGEGGEIGQTFEFEGFSFKICENNTDCAISGINMAPDELVIPAQVTFNGKTYNVTTIGGFKDCVNITSVTIPNSVTSIGESAFWGCNGLTSISIPENVTSIGNGAFRYCNGLTSISIPNSVNSIGDYVFQGCSNLTSATISNNVTSIGTRAFEDCSSLTSITIPKDLTTIGDYAFYGCKGLTSITIPNNVISIGDYAFSYCSGLTSITIPNSVTSIGDNAFRYCSGLNSIIVDTGNSKYDSRDKCNAIIEKESNSLIVGCKNTSIPNGVTSIGIYAFYECKGLTSITVPNSVTSIDDYAFSYCSGLTSITIPNSVTSIGNYAFSSSGLTSITIPNSVNTIGSGAFNNTSWYNKQPSGLLYLDHCLLGYKGNSPTGEIFIENGTRLVANSALQYCSRITSLSIPNSITSIGDNAFYCGNVITIHSYIQNPFKLGSNVFGYGNNISINLYVPKGTVPLYQENWSVFDNIYEWDGTKPENIITFASSEIEKICIDNWDTNHDGFFTTEEAAAVSNIEQAFQQKTFVTFDELKYFTGITTIPNNAFKDCISLVKITIPKNITSISNTAFSGCSKLTTVVSLIQDPFEFDPSIFSDYSYIALFVPKGKLSPYQEQWNSFKYIYEGDGSKPNDAIVFADFMVERVCVNNWDINKDGFLSPSEAASVTDLGTAFSSKASTITSFDELEYFTGLESIPARAFYNCSNLRSVIIPDGVTNIGESAFYNCEKLSSLIIPKNVKTIDNYAFYYFRTGDISTGPYHPWVWNSDKRELYVYISDLSAWCNISFGDKVFTGTTYENYDDEIKSQSIQRYELKKLIKKEGNSKWTTSLNSIIIPEEVTTINSNAFAYCSSLEDVEIPSTVISIGNSAFSWCDRIKSVAISNGATSIGNSVFEGCNELESITIPNSVTSIGSSAFADCSNLESINIPLNLSSITSSIFSGCSSLSSISIPNSVTNIGDAAFRGCSGLTSLIIPGKVTSIGDNAFKDCNNLQYVIFLSESFPTYNTASDIKGRFVISQAAYDNGIPDEISTFSTFSNTPMWVEVKSKGATSAIFEISPIDEQGIIDKENMENVTTVGQTPNQYLNWKLDDDNYGLISEMANETVVLNVQEPKALSTKKARLLATAEEADDAEHYGFEWRRIESSDMISSKQVSAPLFNGKIVGTLNNLKDDVEYKYRPFYKSDCGEMFYGEWMGLFTGDADVFFEPEVYTKDAADITKVSALLAGIWVEGTDDFEEKGFEYWTVSGSKTRSVGSDVKKVVVSGNAMTTTLDGLKSGTTYGFHSYVKTANGSMAYGEEKTFKTILIGDVDGDSDLTDADVNAIAKHIMGQTPTGFNKKMADVNEDGYINVLDIVEIGKIRKAAE